MSFSIGLSKITQTDYSKMTPRQREIIKYKSLAKRKKAQKESEPEPKEPLELKTKLDPKLGEYVMQYE